MSLNTTIIYDKPNGQNKRVSLTFFPTNYLVENSLNYQTSDVKAVFRDVPSAEDDSMRTSAFSNIGNFDSPYASIMSIVCHVMNGLRFRTL